MEEDLTYSVVIQKMKNISSSAVSDVEKTVYAEVKYEEQAADEVRPISDHGKNCLPHIPVWLVTVGLGICSVIIISVIIALYSHLNLQLQSKLRGLEDQRDKLTKERDHLIKIENLFLDKWVYFQSSYYLFTKDKFYSQWRNWKDAKEYCKSSQAHLVKIESQEEQKFIDNHTEYYHDASHGYWIGLSLKTETGWWTWVDGSNLTQSVWTIDRSHSNKECVLIRPRKRDPMTNWMKTSCSMRNRWICEIRV